MQIRTRISIFSALVTLVVGAVIVVGAIQRDQLADRQFASQTIAGQLTLWNKIQDGLIEELVSVSSDIIRNHDLIEALESGDGVQIQAVAAQIWQFLEFEQFADRLEVILPDGNLAYSSHIGVFQNSLVSTPVIKEAINNEHEIRGVGNDRQRNVALVYGTPVYGSDDTLLGFAILGSKIEKALIEMAENNFSSIVLVNRRGRLLATTGGNLWDQYRDLINVREANAIQTISDGDRYFSVLVLPQSADLGGLVGRLVNIREVTDIVQQQNQISRLTIIGIVGFLSLAVVALYLYMSHMFAPLTEGVNVLAALSKGDLEVQIERTPRNDEVGLISNAVNVFRSNLLTLYRIQRSRKRQRGRQERFIYREMTALADTLDGKERDELLKELTELGQMVEQGLKRNPDGASGEVSKAEEMGNQELNDSDNMAMMATAFQNMSMRVQDQHQRLRDSLATKNALFSLRNELKIATRVQQSLLPQNVKISQRFEIWGGMWPAKEVGGDFFDYFQLDQDRFAIAIADVSGKGVPAALFTVMSRTMLHSTATYLDSPAKALSVINNFLEKNNDEGLFVTVFYGILNHKEGTLTYSSGGHNPPILVDSKGARPLEITKGMVLAMFEDVEFEDKVVEMERGARLVLLTDGIPEAFDADNEPYGDERLIDVVSNVSAQASSEDVVRAIVQSVDDFVQDAPQFDDIACVALQFHGGE